MEEILGEHNTDRAFARYLAHWREILVERIESAAGAFARSPGVTGLILAGSNGAGDPRPLPDIDLIPIVAETSLPAALEAIERTRVATMETWSQQGWRTGLDIGRLYFTEREAASIGRAESMDMLELLQDDRWYFALDKSYGGRTLLDPTGDAVSLIAWLTERRFQPEVVALRLERSTRESTRSLQMARDQLSAGNRSGARAPAQIGSMVPGQSNGVLGKARYLARPVRDPLRARSGAPWSGRARSRAGRALRPGRGFRGRAASPCPSLGARASTALVGCAAGSGRTGLPRAKRPGCSARLHDLRAAGRGRRAISGMARGTTGRSAGSAASLLEEIVKP